MLPGPCCPAAPEGRIVGIKKPPIIRGFSASPRGNYKINKTDKTAMLNTPTATPLKNTIKNSRLVIL